MKIVGNNGEVSALVGSSNNRFHDNRRNSRGKTALTATPAIFEAGDDNSRLALRLLAGVKVGGMTTRGLRGRQYGLGCLHLHI